MIKLIFCWLLVLPFLVTTLSAKAQNKYEPNHGITGYDYNIKGELELTFTNSIDLKNGNSQEGTYHLKTPVLLSFNLNDLKFFKANPKEFIGYVENPVIATCGYPCGGGLIDIPQGGSRTEDNWMNADVHFKSLEDGIVTEVNATGEIYPFMELFFSIPDFSEEIKVGMNQLQFRLFIKGFSDSQYHPVRNVKTKSNDSAQLDHSDLNSSQNESDKAYNELLKVDKTLAEEFKIGSQLMAESMGNNTLLPITVTCGTFFGSDVVDALMKNNLLEADAAKKAEFEDQFEKEYFKDLPRIDAMKLIDFLIKPVGNYETPITGSFASDSEAGAENATYTGALKLFGDAIQKSEP